MNRIKKRKLNISVIIPTYNAENTIERALLSVLNQSSSEYIKEVIVINDGSTDSTDSILRAVIREHPKGYLVKYSVIKNAGVSNARNLAIKSSTGNWIALLDSDDYWTEDKLGLQAESILRYKEVRFIGANSQMDSITYGRVVSGNLRKISFMQYMLKSSPSTCSIVFEKSLIDEVGLFDVNQKHAEDSNLFMRMIYRADGYYLKDQLLILDDKPTFGASGLSSNLKAMHLGCLKNIADAQDLKYISFITAAFLHLWENVRYARRIVLTWHRARGVSGV